MNTQQKIIAFYTLLIREILRFSRIWVQTIVPPAITMALYFAIFGHLIGDRIGEMNGFTYIDFIVPGLIMMSIISNSYANVVSSFFGAKYQGNIQEMLVSPMPNYIILLGHVSGGVARGFLVGVVVTLVSLFFTELHLHSALIVLAIFFLTSFLFSLAGFINAVYAKSFDGMNIIPVFILTPLTYLGGVFYSVDLLSPFWQGLSYLNPILYMVNGFRYGFLGVTDIHLGICFGILIVFIVILYSYSLYLLNNGKGIRE